MGMLSVREATLFAIGKTTAEEVVCPRKSSAAAPKLRFSFGRDKLEVECVFLGRRSRMAR